jgi:prepilin-type N-terminal cleavage/methylation domain-containing protein
MKLTYCKNNLKTNGFTLIEVLIVVTIIGILAAIALPQYQNFTKKSKATEATVMLDAIYKEQEAYFAQNSLYAQSLTTIGNPTDYAKYFSYDLTSVSSTSFTATASPNSDGQAAGLASKWQISVDASGSRVTSFPAQGF